MARCASLPTQVRSRLLRAAPHLTRAATIPMDECACVGSVADSPTSALLLLPSARFSPDDKYSRHRVTLKKRFGLLPSQQPAVEY